MKLHRILLLFGTTTLLLTACGDDDSTIEEADADEVTTEEVSYDQKELTYDDVSAIEYGDDLETVYKKLGAPLTEWTSEFVYDSLDDAISRNELTVVLVGDSNKEFTEAIEKEIENAQKATEIDRLKMLQYTYTYDKDTVETALFWISPRTETVVATDKRTYIDENGDSPDVKTEDVSNGSSDSESNQETAIPSYEAYSIGDTTGFSSEDGGMMNVTIDSVSQFPGDDWHTPEGVFFAKVDFTIENIGSTPIDVNSHLFEFYDSESIKSEMISKDYFSETIQNGKAAKGSVYFDVLSDGSTFEVYFADASWTGEYQE